MIPYMTGKEDFRNLENFSGRILSSRKRLLQGLNVWPSIFQENYMWYHIRSSTEFETFHHSPDNIVVFRKDNDLFREHLARTIWHTASYFIDFSRLTASWCVMTQEFLQNNAYGNNFIGKSRFYGKFPPFLT